MDTYYALCAALPYMGWVVCIWILFSLLWRRQKIPNKKLFTRHLWRRACSTKRLQLSSKMNLLWSKFGTWCHCV